MKKNTDSFKSVQIRVILKCIILFFRQVAQTERHYLTFSVKKSQDQKKKYWNSFSLFALHYSTCDPSSYNLFHYLYNIITPCNLFPALTSISWKAQQIVQVFLDSNYPLQHEDCVNQSRNSEVWLQFNKTVTCLKRFSCSTAADRWEIVLELPQ